MIMPRDDGCGDAITRIVPIEGLQSSSSQPIVQRWKCVKCRHYTALNNACHQVRGLKQSSVFRKKCVTSQTLILTIFAIPVRKYLLYLVFPVALFKSVMHFPMLSAFL